MWRCLGGESNGVSTPTLRRGANDVAAVLGLHAAFVPTLRPHALLRVWDHMSLAGWSLDTLESAAAAVLLSMGDTLKEHATSRANVLQVVSLHVGRLTASAVAHACQRVFDDSIPLDCNPAK